MYKVREICTITIHIHKMYNIHIHVRCAVCILLEQIIVESYYAYFSFHYGVYFTNIRHIA